MLAMENPPLSEDHFESELLVHEIHLVKWSPYLIIMTFYWRFRLFIARFIYERVITRSNRQVLGTPNEYLGCNQVSWFSWGAFVLVWRKGVASHCTAQIPLCWHHRGLTWLGGCTTLRREYCKSISEVSISTPESLVSHLWFWLVALCLSWFAKQDAGMMAPGGSKRMQIVVSTAQEVVREVHPQRVREESSALWWNGLPWNPSNGLFRPRAWLRKGHQSICSKIILSPETLVQHRKLCMILVVPGRLWWSQGPCGFMVSGTRASFTTPSSLSPASASGSIPSHLSQHGGTVAMETEPQLEHRMVSRRWCHFVSR